MRFIIRLAAWSLRPWLPAYLKILNIHPTLGEGQNGKLYGSGSLLRAIKGKGSATRDYAGKGLGTNVGFSKSHGATPQAACRKLLHE